ncbi:AraC family transcriptional regulator [Paenibacillus sp. D2_2]|uniref:AraC family transcriptional regulator n=1 Tax=Paenibacillus sp. D2_2 TaxID=3073092 RepID=UPI0028155F13|nr:AraC family transcriptional regulator [Paenibacillus sp. D2_2]WMT43069.1 AraC family transcriptional regulator [Paenibacillus sp. D2_2]
MNIHYSMLFSMFGMDYCYLPFESADKPIIVNHHIILITVRGEGSLSIDEVPLNMKHGKGYLIPPGSVYHIRPGKEGISYYLVLFGMLRLREDGSAAAEEVIPERILCPGELNCQPFSQCIDRLEILYQMRNCRDELEFFEQQIRFQEWLRFIFRQNGFVRTERDTRQAVEASIQHIKQNYQESLTVDHLATLVNITRWQYTRLFKEMTGKVPLEYINDFRIDRAKQQLLMSDDRLFEIAQNVGFNSEYYFNRRFKKSVGVSPGQYRRSYRGEKGYLRHFWRISWLHLASPLSYSALKRSGEARVS